MNSQDSQPKVGLRLQDVLHLERSEALEYISQGLLGLTLEDVKSETRKTLVPYHTNGDQRHSLIISSASSSSASQETEQGILKSRGHLVDIPGAIEGRDVRSAKDIDTVLVNTKSGLQMVQDKNLKVINLADTQVYPNLKGTDIYYKADALLLLMLSQPNSPILVQLIQELAKHPIVYPYNLDEETQIALTWLSQKSRIPKFDVNANSPEVAVELTRKGYKYPSIEDALKLPNYDNPYKMQKAEWSFSKAATEINHHPDFVPGYLLNRPNSPQDSQNQLEAACNLLQNRYSLESAWIKPDRGTDGGNQGQINTRSKDQIKTWVDNMWARGGDWVIEAKTQYFAINFPSNGENRILMTTPSVHVINGKARYTVSLQIVDGEAWGGNLICSKKTWEQLIDMTDKDDARVKNNPGLIHEIKNIYDSMPQALEKYVQAVNTSDKYSRGQVRGGADLAVCTLGGKFGDQLMVAVQDYNARANGCETAYALYDKAQQLYSNRGEAVTRNFTPKVDFNTLSQYLPKNTSPNQVNLIAVSAGWGQIGIIGENALQIMQEILLIESQLRKMDLIQ